MFIEVGAFDGYTYAATYTLECLGWDGLLVEAIPESAELCRLRRPRSRVVNTALGARHGGETTLRVPRTDTTAYSRTFTRPQLLATDDRQIDTAVIDVEGSELDPLAGFDLRGRRPKVLLLEDDSRGAGPMLQDYVAGTPYVQIAWLKVNRVYVRDDLASATPTDCGTPSRPATRAHSRGTENIRQCESTLPVR